MSKRSFNHSLRLTLIVLCMTLSFGFSSQTAQAATTYVTTGSVNFRTGPSTSYAIIDKLSAGEETTLIRKYNSSWYQVNHRGREGYLSTNYLQLKSTPATGLLITTGSVNFRTGPSTSHAVIRNLSQGTVIELVSVHNAYWYQVRCNGTTGYLSPKYVTTYSESPSLGTYVTTGSVNFRTGPSTSYSVIRKLTAGQKVELLSVYNSSWYKVRHNGTTGYLSSRYVTPYQEPGFQAGSLNYRGSGISWYNNFSYDEMKQYPTNHVSKITELLDQRKAVLIGPNFSAGDGFSNYLAGHNPGILSPLAAIELGDTFHATDSSGRSTAYVVTDKVTGTTQTGAAKPIGPSGKRVFDYYFWGVAEECIVIQFCTGPNDAIAVLYAVPAR